MTDATNAAPNARRALPDVMADLAAAKATGVLVASSAEVQREIVFVNGEIRAARSDAEEEKLGKWLVDRDRISEDDRALTLLSQGGSDSPPLGHLLITRGCLEQDALEQELQELTLTIIRRAAAMVPNEADFQEGRSTDQPDTLPDLFTSQIVLIAARALEDGDAKRATIGSLDQIVWPPADLDHILDDYRLTPTEGFLLSRLDGTRTVAKLIQLSALSEDQAITTLYPLLVSGVVHIDRAEAPSGQPPTPAAETVRVAGQIDEEALSDRQQQDRRSVVRMAEEVSRIDHYRALGLRPGASPEDIREAWNKMQRRFDPHRSSEPHLRDLAPQLEAVVERAREAYEVLSSTRDRRRYDRVLKDVEHERESLAGTHERGETDPAARSAIVEANVKRADELIKDGELYLAIQLLEQACALDPRPTELIKLARLLLRNPLWTNRALGCMRRAIHIDPQCVEAWLELAEFWHRRKNPERERKALEKALAASPDDSRASKMYRDLMGKRELERLLRRVRQSRS
jgi:tetratricopeptide (TPR) repeat protein